MLVAVISSIFSLVSTRVGVIRRSRRSHVRCYYGYRFLLYGKDHTQCGEQVGLSLIIIIIIIII